MSDIPVEESDTCPSCGKLYEDCDCIWDENTDGDDEEESIEDEDATDEES